MSTKNFDGIAYTFIRWFDWEAIADFFAKALKANGYYARVVKGNSSGGKPGYKVFARKV